MVNSYNNSTSEAQHQNHSFNTNTFCWYHRNNADLTLTVIFIWLPLVLLAVYSIYSQMRRDRVVPVYSSSLLLSDIIQICCMAVRELGARDAKTKVIIYDYVYTSAVAASIFFMTLVALERFLLISWPLWYGLKRRLRVSVSVCVMSWILSVCFGLTYGNFLGCFLILPLPILIFFLVRTLRSLSVVQVVPHHEKRHVLVVLVAVLVGYTLTFLPRVIVEFLLWFWLDDILYMSPVTFFRFLNVTCTLVQLNPLADVIILAFIKKWALVNPRDLISCRTATGSGSVSTKQRGRK